MKKLMSSNIYLWNYFWSGNKPSVLNELLWLECTEIYGNLIITNSQQWTPYSEILQSPASCQSTTSSITMKRPKSTFSPCRSTSLTLSMLLTIRKFPIKQPKSTQATPKREEAREGTQRKRGRAKMTTMTTTEVEDSSNQLLKISKDGSRGEDQVRQPTLCFENCSIYNTYYW